MERRAASAADRSGAAHLAVEVLELLSAAARRWLPAAAAMGRGGCRHVINAQCSIFMGSKADGRWFDCHECYEELTGKPQSRPAPREIWRRRERTTPRS